MPDSSYPLTRDNALLILNDHCGEEVEVSLMVDLGGPADTWPMVAKGVLRHWQHDDHAMRTWARIPRNNLVGAYDVGDASIDATDLQRARTLTTQAGTYGLEFELTAGATLAVVWAVGDKTVT